MPPPFALRYSSFAITTHFLITAGPTREYLDTVRFLSNPSTGRMGYAIAQAAGDGGHRVTLVTGPVDLIAPSAAHVIRVNSAEEMMAASLAAFESADVAIMTAAVCDYRPVRKESKKLPKRSGRFSLELEPTEDICAQLGRIKGRRIVIGFALEDHDHEVNAVEKLRRKGCDAIVMNDLRVVGAEETEVRVYTADGAWSEPIRGTKPVVAVEIIKRAEELLARSRNGG